ncbi:hypothetical protein IMCC3135_06510 [Granulosicoccus antarcticus IMCC3135]|uniref:Uncharacterized protein n=1 Tax=Granulosicoccus antarcticus IMCC3135 TaxID=1192854 RepID=A0A2Z2NJP9_9GAMM|nr:hypothetical protein IMCC3135_06510 [Granulosicoccus antarcticus IMCC3135]
MEPIDVLPLKQALADYDDTTFVCSDDNCLQVRPPAGRTRQQILQQEPV